jgi:hypothetical protein
MVIILTGHVAARAYKKVGKIFSHRIYKRVVFVLTFRIYSSFNISTGLVKTKRHSRVAGLRDKYIVNAISV